MSDVPHLRFPEFNGEWEKCKIGDIAPLQRGFDLPTHQIEDGAFPVVYSNGIMNYHSSYKCIAPGVVTGRFGTIGKFTFVSNGYYWPHNTSLWVTDFNGNIPEFVYYLYQTINIKQYATGSGVPTLNRNDVHRHKVYVPQIEEQSKIARLLMLLDERIAAQSKVIEDLKKLKSAIIDAMFCSPKQSAPRKRIEGFYTDWQKVHLNEICSRVTRKNTNGRCDLVLTIAAQYGLVSQLDFFNKSVASENLEGYYLLQKGDFAYNKSYSSEYTCGAVKRLERYEEGVLSPLYICFRPDPSKVDSDFLTYYFASRKWNREIMDISVEGARNHGLLNISVIDFFNTIHRIPNFEEQRAIAKVIKTIIHKILLLSAKHEKSV